MPENEHRDACAKHKADKFKLLFVGDHLIDLLFFGHLSMQPLQEIGISKADLVKLNSDFLEEVVQ